MLQNYFSYKNRGELLTFASSQQINDDVFHSISNELADFTVDAYGFDGITPARKRMVAIAAINLFEVMKFKESTDDGTVSSVR